MKSDVMVWVGCILIFVAGVLWSPIIINYNFDGFGYSSLKSILECASYIATIVAACFAVVTLTAWRKQFKHEERFKALSEINDAAVGLSIIGDYIYSVTEKQMNDRLNRAGIGARKDSSDIYHDEWWGAFRAFKVVLDKNSIFLEDGEFVDINSRLSEIELDQRRWVSKFFAKLRSFDLNKNDEMVEFVDAWRSAMLSHIDGLRRHIWTIRKETIG